MIDLHCHILPGVDDGALDLDDAAAMALQAQADGIEVVCATPHVRHDHDVRIAELAGRVAVLNEELARRGIAVRVEPAGEVAAPIVAALGDAELAQVSLGGRWVLLEPHAGPLDERLDEAVAALAGRGYRSLIAHPERHLGPDAPERLAALIGGHGTLVQMTAALLAEGPASAGMLELARRGLLHVLGSDAHSSHGGRRVELSPGLGRLHEAGPLRAHLDWIGVAAPAAILAGEEVEPPYPAA